VYLLCMLAEVHFGKGTMRIMCMGPFLTQLACKRSGCTVTQSMLAYRHLRVDEHIFIEFAVAATVCSC
jgi:hypothetical protein